MSGDSYTEKVAEYLRDHDGAHVRTILNAMVESDAMSWNTAFKAIHRLADDGRVTFSSERRATPHVGGLIAPDLPRNLQVKAVWLNRKKEDEHDK